MVFRYRNHPFVRRLVSPGHDILIEGYPRSANSFCVKSFSYANGWRDVRIATHTHSPAQVKLAVRWGIPSIILFRAPDEAVTSFLALNHQSGSLDLEVMSDKEKIKWIQYMTRRYSAYYREILKIEDRILLVPFTMAVGNFGFVIKKLNAQFNTSFDDFYHEDSTTKIIFDSSRSHLSPNGARDKIKKIARDFYLSDDNKKDRDDANVVYQKCLKSHHFGP